VYKLVGYNIYTVLDEDNTQKMVVKGHWTVISGSNLKISKYSN
jgi:hypothetical protein